MLVVTTIFLVINIREAATETCSGKKRVFGVQQTLEKCFKNTCEHIQKLQALSITIEKSIFSIIFENL